MVSAGKSSEAVVTKAYSARGFIDEEDAECKTDLASGTVGTKRSACTALACLGPCSQELCSEGIVLLRVPAFYPRVCLASIAVAADVRVCLFLAFLVSLPVV